MCCLWPLINLTVKSHISKRKRFSDWRRKKKNTDETGKYHRNEIVQIDRFTSIIIINESKKHRV